MPRLLTTAHAQRYPTLAAAANADELLGDAQRIHDWLDEHPFASVDRVQARAQADGVSAERVNAALRFLVETERIVGVPDAPATRELARSPKDLEEFLLDELQTLARLFDVKGRSSMNREQLIEALRTNVREPAPPLETSPDAVAAAARRA